MLQCNSLQKFDLPRIYCEWKREISALHFDGAKVISYGGHFVLFSGQAKFWKRDVNRLCIELNLVSENLERFSAV